MDRWREVERSVAALEEMCRGAAPGLAPAADAFMRAHCAGALWDAAPGCPGDGVWARLLRAYFALPGRLLAHLELDAGRWSAAAFARAAAETMPRCATARALAVVAHGHFCGTRPQWAAAVVAYWGADDIAKLVDYLPQALRTPYAADILDAAAMADASPDMLTEAIAHLDATSVWAVVSLVSHEGLSLLFKASPKPSKLLSTSLAWWRDGAAQAPETQLVRTAALLFALGSRASLIDDESCAIINGVNARMGRLDSSVSLLARVVAEAYAAVVSRDLSFDYAEGERTAVSFLRSAFVTGRGSTPPAWSQSSAPAAHPPPVDEYPVARPTLQETHAPGTRSLMAPEDVAACEVPRNAKVRPPAFLRDAAAYLRSGEPQRVDVALAGLPSLLGLPGHAALARELAPSLFEAALCVESDVPADVQRAALVALVRAAPAQAGATAARLIAESQSVAVLHRLEAVCAVIEAVVCAPVPRAPGPASLAMLDRALGVESSPTRVESVAEGAALPILALGPDAKTMLQADCALLDKALWLAAACASHSARPAVHAACLAFVAPVAEGISARLRVYPRAVLTSFCHAACRIATAWGAAPVAPAAHSWSRVVAGARALLLSGDAGNVDNDVRSAAAAVVLAVERDVLSPQRLAAEAAEAVRPDIRPVPSPAIRMPTGQL